MHENGLEVEFSSPCDGEPGDLTSRRARIPLPVRSMGRWRGASSRRDGGGEATSNRAVYPRFSLAPNIRQNPIQLVMDIQSPNPNDPNAFAAQPVGAPRIVRDLVRMVMRRAIHLDRQFCSGAVEIQNIRPDRVLFSKTQSAELITLQAAPQPRFGRRQRPSESASALIADPVRHPVAPSVTALKKRRATSPSLRDREEKTTPADTTRTPA